jgi:hypothetical protein
MSYARATTVDSGPTGDTVVQAVLDLDADLTTVFANLNTHEALTTASHGLTSGEGDIVGTDALQTLTRKTITSPTITGGTATNQTITTPTITGGTATNQTITTPTITGGTATNLVMTTPSIGTASGTNLTLSGLSASLPVFTSSNSTLTSKSVADTITALGVGAWTDYSATSTVTGWSSTTVKKIYYTVVNNIVFVYFDIVGTSSQTYARFTVPYNAANTIDIQRFCYAYSLNNGNPLPTNGAVNIGTISKSTAIVDCLFGQGTWTNSGDKIVCGQFYYAK